MPINQFLPFALGPSPNVISQDEWSGLDARLTGFGSGTAESDEFNKAWRQPAFVASGVAQFIADKGALDVLDDGDLTKFTRLLVRALRFPML